MITDIVPIVWGKAEEDNEHGSHCKWENEAVLIIISKQQPTVNITLCFAFKTILYFMDIKPLGLEQPTGCKSGRV